MTIQTYELGSLKTNCYIIINEQTKEAVIIDPAAQAQKLVEKIEEQSIKPVAILLTHGHFDHIMGATDLIKSYPIPIYACIDEKELLGNAKMNCSELFGKPFTLVPDICFKDNEILNLAGMSIKVLHTPGHTIGGTCYYFFEEGVLVSGDTLFFESLGRSDFPTGNTSCLIESIQKKLMTLPDLTKVYPGHGASTTIGHEKHNNPFLNEESFWD